MAGRWTPVDYDPWAGLTGRPYGTLPPSGYAANNVPPNLNQLLGRALAQTAGPPSPRTFLGPNGAYPNAPMFGQLGRVDPNSIQPPPQEPQVAYLPLPPGRPSGLDTGLAGAPADAAGYQTAQIPLPPQRPQDFAQQPPLPPPRPLAQTILAANDGRPRPSDATPRSTLAQINGERAQQGGRNFNGPSEPFSGLRDAPSQTQQPMSYAPMQTYSAPQQQISQPASSGFDWGSWGGQPNTNIAGAMGSGPNYGGSSWWSAPSTFDNSFTFSGGGYLPSFGMDY